jgi:hypothetical protein
MSENPIEGGCQCGAVRFRITGQPQMTAICHCTMCRRAHAAPAVAWAMFEQSQVVFTAKQATLYASSEDAQRGFCSHCGTPICFTSSYLPGLIDIAIGCLDKPEQMPPQFHCWHGERLPWAEFADDLPRHAEFPPMP